MRPILWADRRQFHRVAIFVAVLWVGLCGIFMIVRIGEEERSARASLQRTMDFEMAAVVERLESEFHAMANLAKVLALQPSSIGLLEKREPEREALFALDPKARAVALSEDADVINESRYLQKVVDSTNYLTSFLLDASGTYIAGNIWGSPGVLLGRDYADRAYFRDAMEHGSADQFAVGRNRDVLSIFFTEVVRKGDRRLGVATIRQGTAFLNTQLAVPDAETMVVDEHGVVVASSRPEWILRHLAPSGLPLPSGPVDIYGANPVADLGLTLNDRDQTLAQSDGRHWLWVQHGLHQGKLTLWLIVPSPGGETILRIWAALGLLAAAAGAMLVALIERTVKSAFALRELAHHDQLTGLPNRTLLNDRMIHALKRVKRQGGRMAVLFVDLDKFKPINDTLGHEAGDAVLREVANRLIGCVRASDTVARVGGDEFVVVTEDIVQSIDAGMIAGKIIETLSRPITLGTHRCSVGVSIGIAIFPDDGNTMDEVAKAADSAMYQVKNSGRNSFRFYATTKNPD
jgi:diguanylate cyclase (GGDEF)-like protein